MRRSAALASAMPLRFGLVMRFDLFAAALAMIPGPDGSGGSGATDL